MRLAEKAIRKLLKDIDIVIEVLDARAVVSSTNSLLHQIVKDKPKLLVLNKCDLADPITTQQWVHFLRQQDNSFVVTHSKEERDVQKIITACRKIVPNRNSYIKPLRIMITGVPNVGKSTLINLLNRKKIAQVADLPGVTRSNQFVYIGQDVLLVDTPGLTWHKIEEQDVGSNLSLCNSIGVRAFDAYLLAIYLIDFLKLHDEYLPLLQKRYKLNDEELAEDTETLIQIIGRKRGCLLKENIVDHQKSSNIIIQDFRLGALGRISLEQVEAC